MAFGSIVLFLVTTLTMASSVISSVVATLTRKRGVGAAMVAAMRWAMVAAVAAFLPATAGHAQATTATKTASQQPSATLAGSLMPAVRLSSDLGRMQSSTPMEHLALHFALTDAQQSDLKTLLHALQDSSSAQYQDRKSVV